MKLEFSIAAEEALVVYVPQPIRAASPGAVEGGHGLNPLSGPGQLRADEGAGYPVEDEVLGAFAHRRRNVVEPRVGKPTRKAACRAGRISGLAGTVRRDISSV